MHMRLLIAVLGICCPAVMGWVSQHSDWLVNEFPGPSQLVNTTSGGLPAIALTNGLIKRTFSLAPCFTTVEFELLPTRTKFLRALSPEATLTLNGSPVLVGSCLGQSSGHSEFWDPDTTPLSPNPLALNFAGYEVQPVVAPFEYVPGTWHSPNVSWPPKGLHLLAHFSVPALLPAANASAFLGPLHNTEYGCVDPAQCITGGPACDDAAVPGQCSWPAADAVANCAAWPACAGVNCNPSRSDCQARGLPFSLTSSTYNVFVRAGQIPNTSSTTVTVHYEIYDGLAVIKKWVTVTQGQDQVVVDNLFVEYLRAPNFAPEQITVFQIQPNNPTPFSQQIKPEAAQSFPGRTQQLWGFDPDWDACCDQELHVSYTYYTFLSVGYGPDVTFGGLTGPGALVTPAAAFESISVRLLLHDTTDWERQGIATRRMQATLAPQLSESPLYTMITDISSNETFRLAIETAAAAGLELVVVGYGAAGYCGMCPAQLQDPAWVAWFKSMVDYARTLGLGVSAYTLMQHNGWGETVPAAEQVMNRDGSRGGIACFATDWHAAYRQSILDFVQQVGLVGVETDGQYENAPCADTSGDHHHNGLEGSWHAQMDATAQFNIALKSLSVYQTGADAYMWSGANKWNHADTDAGYALPSLWERLTVGRDYVFDSTTTRLHSSGMYGLGDLADAARACDPSPGRLHCIDFGLASFLGQGVVPDVVAAALWAPSDPDAAAIQAIFANWSAFFRQYRPILTSAVSLHIVRPMARDYEASVHLLSDRSAPVRGFLTVYNPSSHAVNDSIAVSLYYADIAPGTQVSVQAVSPIWPGPGVPSTTHVVGNDGGAIFDILVPVILPSSQYALFTISLVNQK